MKLFLVLAVFTAVAYGYSDPNQRPFGGFRQQQGGIWPGFGGPQGGFPSGLQRTGFSGIFPPGSIQPGFGQPGIGQQGFGQPGFGQPVFGQPGIGQPVFGQQG